MYDMAVETPTFASLANAFLFEHQVDIIELLGKPAWSYADMERRLAPKIEAALAQAAQEVADDPKPARKTTARKRPAKKTAPKNPA